MQDSVTGPLTVTGTAVVSGNRDLNAQLVNTSEKEPDAQSVAELVSTDDIRLYAFEKWQGAGKPVGDGILFWLEAEQEVLQGKRVGD